MTSSEFADNLQRAIDVVTGRGDKRQVIAVAGPPAVGKSTFAEALVDALNAATAPGMAVVLPMDGFHIDNALLDARGCRERKGAPWTFDVGGFHSTLARVHGQGEEPVLIPVFDRRADLARCAAREVLASHRYVVVEGNYLLLDESPWRDLAPCFDLTIRLDAPEAVLEQRLIQRWLDHGLDADAARRRAEGNDLPNARHVLAHSRKADLRLVADG